MEQLTPKPIDVELILSRDDNGFITRIAYKVHNEGDDKVRVLEFLHIVEILAGYIDEPNIEDKGDEEE